MAYNGLALLRQHIKKDESIQSVILSAGKAPNVIPDFSEGSYSLRGKDSKALDALKARVIPIFEGAAAATGCTVDIIW
jgi:metal-dependent amidase/aminoacylase/carboxypeptidase family protein